MRSALDCVGAHLPATGLNRFHQIEGQEEGSERRFDIRHLSPVSGRFCWSPKLVLDQNRGFFGKRSGGRELESNWKGREGVMAGAYYGTLMGRKEQPDEVEYWHDVEREGWLMKQGEYLRNWRRRWFVLKQGRIFWFKEKLLSRNSKPRGTILVNNCFTVKGAEDALNRPFAFELSTSRETMYFIADTDKEKEDWINSIGRSIVRHSSSITENEVLDYDDAPARKTVKQSP